MTGSWDWKARWAFVLLIAVTAALLVTGDKGSASGAGGATPVDIANFAFHPHTLRVKRGARVAFVNSSKVTHTATRGGSFDTGRIKPGTSVVVHFEHKGAFSYHCKIHPFMKGKIVVK